MLGRIGPYRKLVTIARGGVGTVYAAALTRQGGFKKLVALKELRESVSADPAFITMFLEEACTTARLNHPNIVYVHDFGIDGGDCFLVMELLEGQTLARVRRRFAHVGGLPLAIEIVVLLEVLEALHYAHELSPPGEEAIVHLDLGPHKVLLTYDGRIKIMDFGLARAETTACQRHGGRLRGKVAYLSPEQVRGARADRRADIFAVGVMLWEAGAGRPMWGDADALSIMHNLATGDIPSATEAGVPVDLARICDRALAPDPRDRYPTAALLAADVDELFRRFETAVPKDVGRLVACAFPDDEERLRVRIAEAVHASEEAELLAAALSARADIKAGR